MKEFEIKFTPESARQLSKFHPEKKKLIKAALKELCTEPYSGNDLQEELSGFKSYKLKRYRILYRIDDEEDTIKIYYVGHRRDVYEQFRALLSELKDNEGLRPKA
jgi:mRNA interferase RelE/StbE